VSEKNPPEVFLHFPQNGNFSQNLHAYYTFLSTLEYNFFYPINSNSDKVMSY